MSAYQELELRFARHAVLSEATSVLHWDMSTMMPEGGAEARALQLAALKRIGHEILTDPMLCDLFAAAAEDDSLGEWQRANLSEMRRDWTHAAAVPARP